MKTITEMVNFTEVEYNVLRIRMASGVKKARAIAWAKWRAARVAVYAALGTPRSVLAALDQNKARRRAFCKLKPTVRLVERIVRGMDNVVINLQDWNTRRVAITVSGVKRIIDVIPIRRAIRRAGFRFMKRWVASGSYVAFEYDSKSEIDGYPVGVSLYVHVRTDDDAVCRWVDDGYDIIPKRRLVCGHEPEPTGAFAPSMDVE